MNNFEKIKAMSIRELAEYLNKQLGKECCLSRKCQDSCTECTVEWLKETVK